MHRARTVQYAAVTGILAWAILPIAGDRAAESRPDAAAGSGNADSNRPVLRVYDVSDLLQPVRDHSLPDGLRSPAQLRGPYPSSSSGSGTIFGANLEKPKGVPVLTADSLAYMISQMIEPDSWQSRDFPRGHGTLRQVGPRLVITQTLDVHRQIAELLAALRKSRAGVRSLGLTAKWVALSDEEFSRLVSAEAVREEGVVTLTTESLKDLSVLYEGRTTCMAGQTVHFAAGRGQDVMADLVPMIIDPGIGFVGCRTTAMWGPILELNAVLCEDETASVRVYSTVTKPGKMDRLPTIELNVVRDHPKDTITTLLPQGVDRLDYAVQIIQTSLRLPLNRPVLVGGMTSPGLTDDRVLCLVLEVSAGE